MSQNRNAPAYQEYAATILAQLPFRTMSLQDRGLLYTMRLECWVNKQLPNDHNVLAKAFGLPVDEVKASLPAVMQFFKIESKFIICPELEDYRMYLEERKRKQSQGGKTGSAITNDKRKATKEGAREGSANLTSTSSSNSSSNSQVSRRGSDESLVQYSSVQHSLNQCSKEKDLSTDTFITEYEDYEATHEHITSDGAPVHEDKEEYVNF